MKLIDAQHTYIDPRAVVADDVVIYPNNHLIGACVIGAGTVLMPNNIITDTAIGAGCTVTASVLQEASVGDGTTIGPNAYLRKGSNIGRRCRIGDFVEIKNAEIGDGSKVSHLAYVGDCTIGKDCNIGCGVIFVNYDGVSKHRTAVGDGCFIGSNCNVIAPVRLSDGCYVAAGTTVDKDAPADALVIGRVRADYKAGRALRLRGDLRRRAEQTRE